MSRSYPTNTINSIAEPMVVADLAIEPLGALERIGEDDGLVAVGTDGEHHHRRLDPLLHEADVVLGGPGELLEGGDPRQVFLPSRQGLVDRLHLLEHIE